MALEKVMEEVNGKTLIRFK